MRSASKQYSLFLFTVIAALVLLQACSDLKTDLPAPATNSLKVHPDGWTTPASANFHGKDIRERNWDMLSCQTCHGSQYDGGVSQASCRTCHNKPAGPENCTTCHGGTNSAPPRDLSGNTAKTARGVGTHQIHVVGGTLTVATPCTECHSVPPTVYTIGHVDTQSPAEVLFKDPLANTTTNEPGTATYSSSLPLFKPVPSYDAQTAKCSNTYCHGNFKNGNTSFAPVWNDATGTQAACGTCHGDVTKTTLAERALPKTTAQGGTHPVIGTTTCDRCHGDVVDATMKIINTSKHINGKISIGTSEFDF